MAARNFTTYSLYQRNGIYWISIRLGGKRSRRTLRTRSRDVAEERAKSIYAAHLVTQGYSGDKLPDVDPDGWARQVAMSVLGDKSWVSKLYAGCKSRAAYKKLKFDLTFLQLKELAIACGGRCMVTHAPLNPDIPKYQRVHPFQPSIDRISSSDGYTAVNCRIVCYAANLAMSTWGAWPLRTMLTCMAREVA